MNCKFSKVLLGMLILPISAPAQTIIGNTESFTVERGFWDDNWELGDVNHDGIVDNLDVEAVTKKLLDEEVTNFDESLADMNSDSKINIVDVVAIINKSHNENAE